MADFATAYTGWLDYDRANGFAVEHFLHPPASAESIAALGREIGLELPDDLTQL